LIHELELIRLEAEARAKKAEEERRVVEKMKREQEIQRQKVN
jgi:hypothetical protein